MFWNEFLQLLNIPLGLGKSGLREIHRVTRHGDAHIVTLCILQEETETKRQTKRHCWKTEPIHLQKHTYRNSHLEDFELIRSFLDVHIVKFGYIGNVTCIAKLKPYLKCQKAFILLASRWCTSASLHLLLYSLNAALPKSSPFVKYFTCFSAILTYCHTLCPIVAFNRKSFWTAEKPESEKFLLNTFLELEDLISRCTRRKKMKT